MATITDTLQAGLEQVAPTVKRYRDADQGLLRHFKPSKKATVSRYLYRVPYFRYSGGAQAKSNMDGGAIVSGNGPAIVSFKAGWIDNVISFAITQEQIDLSASSEQSRVNIVTDILTNALKTALDHDNVDLFGDGTGKLTNSSSAAPSTTTLTFAGATDTLKTNRLFRGRMVDLWASDGTTLRADGPYYISAVNHSTGVVTFTSAPTAMASGDMLTVADSDVYGPAAPTSFSSTWPGGALTNGSGLTGDSWRHGLSYVNDNTTTNYYLGLLKSTYPELVPVGLDLSGEALTFAHAEIIKSLMIQARDETVVNGVMAVMHTAQQTALKNAVSVIQRWDRSAETEKQINLQPGGKYNDTFQWGEFTAVAVKAADKARVDLFNPSAWGTVEGHPTEWYKSPDNGSMIERDRNSSGQRLNSYSLSLKQKFDWVCDDVQSGAFITGAKVPDGL